MFDDDHLHTHAHDDACCGRNHVGGDGNGAVGQDALPEAPLDAANQSLADALRASFRVLKFIMVIVLICYLGSGLFIVDQTQVAVYSRLGKVIGGPCRPGAHWGWPYPFAEIQLVSTAPNTIKIEDFWFKLNEVDKAKSLEQVYPRANGLDPAIDGALLTSDRAIMHALFEVQYQIPEINAKDCVQNVKDPVELVRSVVKQAAVAETARTTARTVLQDSKTLAGAIQKRAQAHLDRLEAGITIDSVIAPKSHYPLQTTTEFIAVDRASNLKNVLINDAQSERQKKLNGAAGEIWEAVNSEIEKIDRAETDDERDAIIQKIGDLLASRATGEAGGKIKFAQRDREKIVNDTLSERSQFEALLDQYRKNPELVRSRLSQSMREELFGNKGVSKWVLPPSDKQVVLWLAVDPKELAQRERDRLEDMKRRR